MTTIQIRKAVFETNSSSSHSLTLGKADLVAMPFTAAQLREGTIYASVSDYNWEYARYYTAFEKICYLLTQATRGVVPPGDPAKVTAELCYLDARLALLCQVVQDHTGCELVFCSSEGGIDHDSDGLGLELFDSAEGLRDFLFDETAYIETSNDNSPPPWWIVSDKSQVERYYEHVIQPIPDDFVKISVSFDEGLLVAAFSTTTGGMLVGDQHPDVFSMFWQSAIVESADWYCEDSISPFRHHKLLDYSAAALMKSKWNGTVLALSESFDANLEFKKIVQGAQSIKQLTCKVAVPAVIAEALAQLPIDGKAKFMLSKARDRRDMMKQRLKTFVKKSQKPDEWVIREHARYVSEVAKLTKELKSVTAKLKRSQLRAPA